MNMVALLWASGLRYNEKIMTPGAQTKCRGYDGSVSVQLHNWAHRPFSGLVQIIRDRLVIGLAADERICTTHELAMPIAPLHLTCGKADSFLP